MGILQRHARQIRNYGFNGADIPLNAIRSQLAAGIDIMVHLARMPDKTRKVIEINEIQEFKDNQIILNKLYCMENGKLKK